MRTKHSLKNISISLFSQVVIVILGLVSRKVFLNSLGVNYLGINGLLTNILSMLALVESGIGISIVYNLYKPLADDDTDKITALVQLYRKAYGILALIVLLISTILYPFLGYFIKNGDQISNITIVYFIFVVKTMVSYLNAHKWSLINADQRGYILAKMNLLFQVSSTIAKIIILTVTKNYILYLTTELLIFLLQNIINGFIVNKRYPYIKTKTKFLLNQSTIDNIKTNVKAMFLHNIGGYLVFGTDNILISTFVGLASVGIYSNYTMIIDQLVAFIRPILGGIGASVGNLVATENSEKKYFIFKTAYLVNFWVYSLCIVFLYNLLEPFINWWLGGEYLLDDLTYTFILVNLYLTGMRTAISTFKNKAGLFVQDRYASLFEGFINMISSLVLVKTLGLSGIFIGTTISTISTVFWTQPYIVYKNVFQKSVWSYYKRYGFYVMLTLLTCFISTGLCNLLVVGNSLVSLIEKGIICVVVPNLFYIAVFHKSEEFQYIRNVLSLRLPGLKLKLTSAK